MMAQQQEVNAVYAKYGVSPSGSCVQILIQMPILFALYRVIYSMPAYVTKIGNTFRVLAEHIISKDNGQFLLDQSNNTIANCNISARFYKPKRVSSRQINIICIYVSNIKNKLPFRIV